MRVILTHKAGETAPPLETTTVIVLEKDNGDRVVTVTNAKGGVVNYSDIEAIQIIGEEQHG